MAHSPEQATATQQAGEDSMGAEIGGFVAEQVAERVIPKGIEWVYSWWSGKRVLILGPARSGKTSFLKYLEADLLFPERNTKRTTEVKEGDSFTFLLGGKRKVRLRIWKPRDVPGDVAPEEHVLYVERYRPDCIVIVLDAAKFFLEPGSKAKSSLEWLREFCQYLNTLLKGNEGFAAKLESMIVIMNKWDKIPSQDDKEDAENKKAFESYIRKILDEHLNNSFYSPGGTNVIEVIPCALVVSKYEEALANDAVNRVASSLT